MRLKKLIIIVAPLVIFISSCNVTPSIMMKTEKDYQYDPIPSDSTANYII